MTGNTVAYSSKQLLISPPQNYFTKSTEKFPKKVVHASYLQYSVYIGLDQDDDLAKINLNILRNHRVRKARHVKYGSIMSPHIFPWKS